MSSDSRNAQASGSSYHTGNVKVANFAENDPGILRPIASRGDSGLRRLARGSTGRGSAGRDRISQQVVESRRNSAHTDALKRAGVAPAIADDVIRGASSSQQSEAPSVAVDASEALSSHVGAASPVSVPTKAGAKRSSGLVLTGVMAGVDPNHGGIETRSKT